MGLAYEIRRETARLRALQDQRNAEARAALEAEQREAAELAKLTPDELKAELKQRHHANLAAQDERNAAATGKKGSGKGKPKPENKAAEPPPENKAADASPEAEGANGEAAENATDQSGAQEGGA